MTLRERILSEIRRLAEQDGQPPGTRVFTRETGIARHEWLGVYWAAWGDALIEAGFKPNQMMPRRDRHLVLREVAEACRHFKRFPSEAQIRMYRLTHPSFPTRAGIPNHFRTKSELAAALARWCAENPEYADVAAMLPAAPANPEPEQVRGGQKSDGSVYLLQSGDHYKIGRSDEIERRVKEIRVQQPKATTLVHMIRTDDPAGIEAYWHRRFADRRANGEWFKLSAADIAAFRKRKYQ